MGSRPLFRRGDIWAILPCDHVPFPAIRTRRVTMFSHPVGRPYPLIYDVVVLPWFLSSRPAMLLGRFQRLEVGRIRRRRCDVHV